MAKNNRNAESIVNNYQYPILFCGISWMNKYQGRNKNDKPINGGSFVDKYKTAHEVCNFLPCSDGKVYGHVETLGNQIVLEKLDPSAKSLLILDNVTVVWTATPKTAQEKGRRIVGWYRNAKVYRYAKSFKSYPSKPHEKDNIYNFRIEAAAHDAFLLEPEDRESYILGSSDGSRKDWIGTNALWYPLEKLTNPDVLEFMAKVVDKLLTKKDRHSIAETTRPAPNISPEPDDAEKEDDEEDTGEIMIPKAPTGGGPWRGQSDPEENRKVEEAAIAWVNNYYLSRYDGACSIDSVEELNRGWDLEIFYEDEKCGQCKVTVEVKGRSSDDPFVGITPRELKALRGEEKSSTGYRLIIVCNALTSNPVLYYCFWSESKSAWKVKSYIPVRKRKVINAAGSVICHRWKEHSNYQTLEFEEVTAARVKVTNI